MQFKSIIAAAAMATVALAQSDYTYTAPASTTSFNPTSSAVSSVLAPPTSYYVAPTSTSVAPVLAPAPTCACPAAPPAPPAVTVTSTVYVTVPGYSSTIAPAPPTSYYSSPAPYPTGGSSTVPYPTGTGVPTVYPTPTPFTGAASSMNGNVIVAGLSAVLAAFALL